MKPLSAGRRVVLSFIALAVSAVLLRSQIADALVLRGDACLYRNSPLQALRFYRRALAIDGGDGIAADRYAFVAMTVRRPAVVRDAIAVASGYLQRNAADVTVRMDRAMCYRAIGDAGNALADFDTVAKATRDIRALAFAGYAARALGRPQQARRFWQAALAIQPRFPAALDGLSRMEQTR